MTDFSCATNLPSVRAWVTCGPGSEPIDAVRRITNHSTGAHGAAPTDALDDAGFDVTAWVGEGASVVASPPTDDAARSEIASLSSTNSSDGTLFNPVVKTFLLD